MGVDIHMYVVRNGRIIKNDIFDGRNSEWFSNLQGDGWNEEYDHLPVKTYNVSDQAPEELQKEAKDTYYYGHRTITVGDYKKWFEKYRPDKHASWVTTYEEWQYRNKGIAPDKDNIKTRLEPDDILEDWKFLEWADEYDLGRWLYEEIYAVADDAEITYWFDH